MTGVLAEARRLSLGLMAHVNALRRKAVLDPSLTQASIQGTSFFVDANTAVTNLSLMEDAT